MEGGTTLKVTDESLAQAARVIRDGGLVVIPTDTVYGVACDPRNKAAIDRIYRLKRRPRYKALQVLLASTDQLDELGLDLPSPLKRLSAAFLPGAFRSGSYCFDGWYTERNGGELITTSTVFAANTIVYAHWTYTGGSGGSGGYVPGYYIIRATAGAGGFITPSGDVSVRAGANQTFTITPNRGYAVSDVKIDGRSIGAVRSYTFENISASHTIEVQFRVRSSFVDVPSGSYYEDAVDWAVANGITTGTDAAHFSPDGICTRAQAVTFLWRAAGRPAPESRTMPFTDVPADSYYYDAVLWAVENGITKGTSSTTFSPDDTCTRAQIVTFLWRSEQSPAAGSSNPFTDVSADAYYADAVLWAVKEAITTGTTRTTFSPDAECTRAQIVTFLWRCKK